MTLHGRSYGPNKVAADPETALGEGPDSIVR